MTACPAPTGTTNPTMTTAPIRVRELRLQCLEARLLRRPLPRKQ
jgi:hypothetical protein